MLKSAVPRRVSILQGIRRRFYHAGAGEFGHLMDLPRIPSDILPPIAKEHAQRVNLINAFRRYGYLAADLDPLGLSKTAPLVELNPLLYGEDGVQLAAQLKTIYCGTLAIESMHINASFFRFLLLFFNISELGRAPMAGQELRAGRALPTDGGRTQKVVSFDESLRSNLFDYLKVFKFSNFDHFLALKFPSVKRYGSEGAEAMYAFFSEMFDTAPETGIREIFIGMAHRGRLNLLNEMMHFPTVQMFRKMKGKTEFPEEIQGSGDVLSHLTSFFDHVTPMGGKVHLSMLPNPSHLEAVNPVAMGKTRARAWSHQLGDYCSRRRAESRPGDGVLSCLVHGDGAFAGQGVVWESLALSRAPHFRLGGSIHLVINNQIAFTAESHIGCSTTHCTDIAKAFEFPVLHVNGEHPEDLAKATRLAMAYREKFRKDVLINLVCYRRWGHNELDDPSFTQPLMYKAIQKKDSLPKIYAEELEKEGILKKEELQEVRRKHTEQLMVAFKAVETSKPSVNHLEGLWKGYRQAPAEICRYETGVDLELLKFVGAASVTTPDDFNLHPHLKKMHCETRIAKLTKGEGLDWATAEALAFGSLLVEGNDVRISGQDVGRGTFSHRHAMLVDQETDESYLPLNHIHPEQKNFLEVANNLLSEEAILGFEYGFSLENPRRLCIWEAQFGDFFTGAQMIIDTYLASGESKWLTQSGLTLLLPHGFDGAGPEHSSCRLERFLQLCDSSEDQQPVDGETVNMRLANPTTAAQYFHLLRRQLIPTYRKPLIVVGPKILLRHPRAASNLADFAPGTYFQEVIVDASCQTDKVEKIVFVSGKFWLDVEKAREERGLRDRLAIVRLESLCPFPARDLQETVRHFANAKNFVWAQEEPRNAGAWSFVRPRFRSAVGLELRYAGRPELAWTATAVAEKHSQEKSDALEMVFE